MESVHKGEIVEKAVRQSGYTIKHVANSLGITRNTLYSRFRTANLSDEFILRVGDVINHDFSIKLPTLARHYKELKEGGFGYQRPANGYREGIRMEHKYMRLLEDYRRLLSFLVKIANDNEFHSIKQQIDSFIEENELV